MTLKKEVFFFMFSASFRFMDKALRNILINKDQN